MVVTLSDTARQFIALFEDETGATARDCVIFEEDDGEERVVFLVKPGDMGKAIGSGGETVRSVESQLDREVVLVEDADTPEAFVANALAPAAVYNVTVSEDDETVAYAEVDSEDTGVAIGEDGRNIAAAETLAKRHYDIDDIQLT
ncbi:NusA-like transcription termination signal-binding factor [Halorussus gelatinilyticus]|uniref:Probable transcription termination protein NusA n=1 Tax=Halorussus gelatinilyticus TaxID=2937524 RepID=A0A8U0IFC0_9EURY|nr:NusA-like transcription termination signal-binding factor [Halorussus gelatinilyticus]UPV98758.1 NusA-like transcription termination signal-binding factor [Halorussus gelatinilyticus]